MISESGGGIDFVCLFACFSGSKLIAFLVFKPVLRDSGFGACARF